MSLRALTSVWEQSKQKDGALLVMLALADNANDQMIAYPSVPTLARKARLSDRQVRRILQALCDAGEIKNIGKYRNNVNIYLLTPDLSVQTITDETGVKPGHGDRAEETTKPGHDVTPQERKPGHIVTASPDTKPGHIVSPDTGDRAGPDIAMSTKPSLEPSDVVVVAHEALNFKPETLDRMESDLAEAAGKVFSPTSLAIHDMSRPILWLQRGDDWSLDVLPTVKLLADAVLARDGPGGINSWKYFDRAIAQARMRRLGGAEDHGRTNNFKTGGDSRSAKLYSAILASGGPDGCD